MRLQLHFSHTENKSYLNDAKTSKVSSTNSHPNFTSFSCPILQVKSTFMLVNITIFTHNLC